MVIDLIVPDLMLISGIELDAVNKLSIITRFGVGLLRFNLLMSPLDTFVIVQTGCFESLSYLKAWLCKYLHYQVWAYYLAANQNVENYERPRNDEWYIRICNPS